MIDEMRDKFGGRPFTPLTEWMPTEESAINAVAQDAYGMVLMDYWNNVSVMNGVTTWKHLPDFGPRIKFVPMVIDDKGTLSDGTMDGKLHPMASAIGININRGARQTAGPLAQSLLRVPAFQGRTRHHRIARDAQSRLPATAAGRSG